MNYSCTAIADDVFIEIGNIMNKDYPSSDKISNKWEYKKRTYFYERGRENQDGAITGGVFELKDDGYAYHTGSFKISAGGEIERFSHLPTVVKNKINDNQMKEE